MKTSLDCIPCFVRQTLDACRMVTDDPAIHETMIREVMAWISEMDLTLSPPALAQRIHRKLREITGVEDPYDEDKKAHNQMALDLIPGIEKAVKASSDPLVTAVHYAIAGNIIDMGAKSGLSDADIHVSIAQAAHAELAGDPELFRSEVKKAKKILYLADNAGEIVFDRLLIEQLGPQRVTVAVRGKPIINDATLEDAKTAGIDQIVRVIGNGSDAPGTMIDDCSEEFQTHFYSSDLILSKGQGNFESLNETPLNIFFLLKAKCPVVAELVGQPVGTHVLYKQRSC